MKSKVDIFEQVGGKPGMLVKRMKNQLAANGVDTNKTMTNKNKQLKNNQQKNALVT